MRSASKAGSTGRVLRTRRLTKTLSDMKVHTKLLMFTLVHLCVFEALLANDQSSESVIADGPFSGISESHFGPRVSSKKDCDGHNGTWKVYGESLSPRCFVPTSDGGKSCNDHSECQGLCVAPPGPTADTTSYARCTSNFGMIGHCASLVSNGEVGRPLCVD